MSECCKCNCEGNFKVEYTKEGEICTECFQNDKIQSLESEIKQLKKGNEKLRTCVEFYADKRSWSYYGIDEWSQKISGISSDTEMLDGKEGYVSIKYYGGKLARQTLKELGERE